MAPARQPRTAQIVVLFAATAAGAALLVALVVGTTRLPSASPPAGPAAGVVAECGAEVAGRFRRSPCTARPDLVVRVRGRRLARAWQGRYVAGGPGGWSELSMRPGGIRPVAQPGAGTSVGLFEVGPGDSPVPSGERAEAVASRERIGGDEGTESWYAWSTWFPRDFRPVARHTWNLFAQWHGSDPGGCRPNVSLLVNTVKAPPVIRLGARGGALDAPGCRPRHDRSWDTVPLRLGRWSDFLFHVRWSASPRRGFVELLVDGRVVVPRTSAATLYAGQGVYLKQGFYRAPARHVSRVIHGGMTRLRPPRP